MLLLLEFPYVFHEPLLVRLNKDTSVLHIVEGARGEAQLTMPA